MQKLLKQRLKYAGTVITNSNNMIGFIYIMSNPSLTHQKNLDFRFHSYINDKWGHDSDGMPNLIHPLITGLIGDHSGAPSTIL